MRKTFRPWFIIDIIILISVGVGVLLFAKIGKPYKRGFFCNDESIRKPYKDSTVPSAMAVGIAAAISFVVITVTELSLKLNRQGQYSTSVETVKCFSMNIPKVVTTIIWFIYVDIYGAGLTAFTTDVGKYCLGRLRPHFMDVCKPAWGTFNCTDETGANLFVTSDVCTAAASKMTKEMRLSFPSGHSSFAAYTMMYLVLYIEAQAKFPKESKFLKLLLQAILTLLALFTGFSRVSDYKHHWSDVLAGFILGGAIAVIVIIKVCRLKVCQAECNRTRASEAVDLPGPDQFGVIREEPDLEAS
eukprot:gene7962-8820_t